MFLETTPLVSLRTRIYHLNDLGVPVKRRETVVTRNLGGIVPES